MPSAPSKQLKTFPNPAPERDYEIAFDCPEFTCICPLTGQPDFAHFRIGYVPEAHCVELKSLKLYLWSYRNEGAFHEAVSNQILGDLVKALQPRRMTVEGDFFVRGGISTRVTVTYEVPRPAFNAASKPLRPRRGRRPRRSA
jgi:7-cyano-7-deazaguanine reductase